MGWGFLMAFSAEVKCSRCDKRYSALRGRCPYCGARRSSKGKYAGDPDNMKGRTIIGVLILVALLAAVIALIIISVRNDEGAEPTPPASTIGIDDSTNTQIPGPSIEPSPTPPEESFVPPPPSVQSVAITYAGATKTDITEKVGTTLTFKANILPADIDLVPEWTSSDPSVFEVVPEDTSGLTAKVTMIGKGNATLKLTVGDKTAECIIRVK